LICGREKIMKNQINNTLEKVCCQGLDQGVFQGVSAAVSVRRKTARYRGLFCGGWTRSDAHREMVNRETLFDLASLTKPLCTTLCMLHLVGQGRLTLHTTCQSMLEAHVPADKQGITIGHLLGHCSGLPSYLPYFKGFHPIPSRENMLAILDLILKEPLQNSPGTTRLYSDLGFILLAAMIENSAGIWLEEVFRRVIADPLHLSAALRFLPLDVSTTMSGQSVAATENCSWRRKIVQGEVHDEHCWLMGGVAGHAGLFGTAEGVMQLCEGILDAWKGRGPLAGIAHRLMQRALTTQKDTVGCRRLGFDTPTPGRSTSGRFFSSQSAGHLGFSGTSFWIDPDQEVIMVLLTNRIHPTRTNEKIKEFRPLFHDIIMEAILDGQR
jgi:serine-type D-Ala-D-Ala carboxypeptidase